MKTRGMILGFVVGFAAMLMATQTQLSIVSQIKGILSPANGGEGVNATTVTALGNTGSLTMNMSLGQIFTTTPSGAITLVVSNCATGLRSTIIVTTSGTTSYTITPSTNMKGTALSTGTTSGKTFGWSFVCNGTTAYQMGSATAAM